MAYRKYGMARRGRGKRTYRRGSVTRRRYNKGLSKPQAKAVRRIAKRVSYKLGPQICLESAPNTPAVISGALQGVNSSGFSYQTSTVSVNDLFNAAAFFATNADELGGSSAWWSNTKVQLTYRLTSFDKYTSPDFNKTINIHVYLVTLKRGFPVASINATTGGITLSAGLTHTQRYDHCLLNTEYFDIHASRKFKLGHDNAASATAGQVTSVSAFVNEKSLYLNCPRKFRLNNVAGGWKALRYCPSKTRNYYVLTFATLPDGTHPTEPDESYAFEYQWMITHKLRQLS